MNYATPTSQPVRIACSASPSFQAWLAEAGGSLVVSTYQAGKVAMIGFDGQQVTLLMREFDKPMGMAARDDRMVLATRNCVWMFANAPWLAPDYMEDQPGRYDALYLPRATYHTGDLNTHDVAFAGEDVVLAASRFSCLARLSHDFSFTPIWKPDFITDMAPEDRCHLNGLAIRDDRPRYVTALGTTDQPGGWRENKATGGVLIDVESNEILAGGMAMPHSPRWHDGRLWVLNSGTGELWQVDPESGQSTVVCGLPGYPRGLCFVGPHALIGLSKIRENHIFGGLPVQQRRDDLLCGVAVVDTRSGRQVGLFEYTMGCEEIYEVQFLPDVYRPTILNLEKPAVYQAITNPDSCYWLRRSSQLKAEPVPYPSTVQPAGPAAAMGKLLPDSGN